MFKFISTLFALLMLGLSVGSAQKVSEGFENGWLPTNWTSAVYSGSVNWNRETADNYPSHTACTGSYMAYYDCWDASSTNSAILYTPSFSLSDRSGQTTRVRFNMYRSASYTYYDSLEVMINTSASYSGATWLGGVCAYTSYYPSVGAAGWYSYYFDVPSGFTGTTNYVLFWAVSGFYNNICIDDVTIYYPTTLAYSSCTAVNPPSAPIIPGSTNQVLCQANVVVSGEVGSVSATQFIFNTTGTTKASDITNAKLWFMSTNSTFNAGTATLLGTIASPSGNMTFNVNQALTGGSGNVTNYFFLTYDIAAGATVGDYAEANWSQVTVGGSNKTPSTQNCSTRQIMGPMIGSYTVGSGGNYATLNLAMADLAMRGLSGNTTLTVISNITEPGPIVIQPITYTGGPWTLTITANSSYEVDVNAGGANSYSTPLCSTQCVVYIKDGVQYLTIDGTASKYLTFKNTCTNQSYTMGISSVYESKPVATYNNIIIQNINILTSDQTSSHYFYGISYYYPTTNYTWNNFIINNNTITGQGYCVSTSTYYYTYGMYLYFYYNNNLTITNNTITQAYYGIYMYAYYSNSINVSGNTTTAFYYGMYLYPYQTTVGMTFTCNNNTFGNASDNSKTCGYAGLVLSGYLQNGTVNNNTFVNIGNTWYTYPCYGFQFSPTMGTVNGVSVAYNTFKSIFSRYASGSSYYSGVVGLYLSGGNGVLVHDNKFSDISGQNYAGGYTYPYLYYGHPAMIVYSGTSPKVYHNTINMTTSENNQGTVASITCGIYCYSPTTADIRNNIFINTMSHNVAGSKSYAIGCYYAGASYQTLNYNNYYVAGAYGVFGWYTSSYGDQASLASWQSVTGMDANSQNLPVTFTSATDFHLNGTSAGDWRLSCPTITAYPDMDNITRNATYTNMGTDEAIPNGVTIPATITNTPNNAVYCINNALTLSVTPTWAGTFADGYSRSGVTIYPKCQWYKGTVSFSPIAGQTNTSRVFASLIQTDSSNYYLNTQWPLSSINTNSATKIVIVQTPMSIITQPLGVMQCSTNPTLVLSTVVGGTVYGLQWQFSTDNGNTWSNCVGQTSAVYNQTYANINLAAGAYRCQLTGPGNCSISPIYTNTVNVTIANPLVNFPTTLSMTDPSHACAGTDIQVTNNTQGTILGYQWWYSPDKIQWKVVDPIIYPTSQSKVLVIPHPDPTNTGYYSCLVTGTPTCLPSTKSSDTTYIKVWNYYTITSQPSDYVGCQSGNNISLFVQGNGLTYGYQWQKDGVDIPLNVNATAQSNMFVTSANNFDNGGVYTCRIAIEDCRGKINLFSRNSVIFIERKTQVTVQPKNTNANIGDNVSYQFEAQVIEDFSVHPELQVTVQWYKLKGGVATAMVDDARISGAKSSLMSISNVNANDYTYTYYAVVNALCGSDQTAAATLSPGPGVNITAQPPTAPSFCEGKQGTITLTAVPSGSGKALTYQWYFNSAMVANGVKYTGATASTLAINNVASTDAGPYYCAITVDGMTTVNSNISTVSVIANPAITVQPSSATITSGKPLTLFVVATGSGLSYQWFFNSAALTTQTKDTLFIASAATTDDGDYYCVITNQCSSVTSDIVHETVTYVNVLGVTDNTGNNILPRVIPNPTSDLSYLVINSNTSRNLNVRLFNAIGKEITVLYNSTVNSGEFKIPFNTNELNLVDGVYFFVISDETGYYATAKFEVIR